MVYKVLIRFVVFVGCLASINGETLKWAYKKKQLNEFISGEAYLGLGTETEVILAADCNSFNYNSNNGSCHLNAGVVRKNISCLTEVANYRYYEFYEEVSSFIILTKNSFTLILISSKEN